jgi:hypothetical protein
MCLSSIYKTWFLQVVLPKHPTVKLLQRYTKECLGSPTCRILAHLIPEAQTHIHDKEIMLAGHDEHINTHTRQGDEACGPR